MYRKNQGNVILKSTVLSVGLIRSDIGRRTSYLFPNAQESGVPRFDLVLFVGLFVGSFETIFISFFSPVTSEMEIHSRVQLRDDRIGIRCRRPSIQGYPLTFTILFDQTFGFQPVEIRRFILDQL